MTRTRTSFISRAITALVVVIVCLAVCAALSACAKQEAAAPTKEQKMKNAEEAVTALVSEYGDKVAVTVRPLDGTEGFSINGDKSFVSASMIKLLILAEYMAEVDAGTLDPNTVYVLDEKDVVGGSGVIQEDPIGTTYTYDELVRQMIQTSDNTATNVLIDVIGMQTINDRATALGLTQTNLQRKMMDLDAGVENHISSNEAADILFKIGNHTLASEQMCVVAEDYLLGQKDNDALAMGLPADVKFGHKTGDLDFIRHDGGIVYADNGPYVLVVLTELDMDPANELMRNIAVAVSQNLS